MFIVSNLKSRLIRPSAACALICLSTLAHASPSEAASAVAAASQAATAPSADVMSARPVVGDDPVAIRDTLAKEGIHANAPSLSERILNLIPSRKTPHDVDLTKAGLDGELVFVVPVPYGVLYRSKTHKLTIDADLASDEAPGAILLKKTVTGPSGRGLVIAAEAKAKGYIQQIDLIELKLGETSKTKIREHINLSQASFAKTNGDFAIALMCHLSPPYLSDRREHSDPTDDEPTDITTRTSILHADIQAVRLISPQTGMVLSKNLHLSN